MIAGLRELSAQQFGYDSVAADGIAIARTTATAVDAAGADGHARGRHAPAYDRLVLAPGIDFRWGALPGYDEAAAEKMPHAWKAGAQTLLLRRQLEAMEDGGLVVIVGAGQSLPLPARALRAREPDRPLSQGEEAEIQADLLDAKDAFSKQRLFQNAWAELYPGLIEWVSLSKGGKVTSVDPATPTLVTDFGQHKAAVANVIPPQKAGRIAEVAGVADRTGWCPIDPATFESKLLPGIHVIGDAAIAGAMPKSAFAANAQAKVCAAAVAQLLAGRGAVHAEADQHLLQPGGARLRHLGRRGLRAVGRTARRGARRGRRQPADAPRSTRAAEAVLRRGLVPDHHRRGVRLRLRRGLRSPPSARLWRGAGGAAATRRRRRDPGVADRRQGRSGARPRHRRQPPGRPVPAVPQRALPGGALPGQPRARSGGRRARWSEGQLRLRIVDSGRINPATIMPAYYRTEGLMRVAPAWRGKPVLTAEQIEDVVAFLMTLRD